METNTTLPVSENKNKIVLLTILAVFIVILLGVLYFVKQKDMGEITKNDIEVKKPYAPTIDELIELTTAPEKNLENIQPNPELVAATTAPEKNIHMKADKEVVDELSAPEKQ